MKTIKHSHLLLLGILWAVVFGSLGFQVGSAAKPEVVLRNPAEDELVVINGCVVSACQFLASVRAKQALDENFWSRVLLVRYKGTTAGHAYCVWETDGHIFGYDRNNGGYPIPGKTRDPVSIASSLAVELTRVMDKEMVVEAAQFIEPREAKLYAL